MPLHACARIHLMSRGLSHRSSSKAREQVRFELGSSGFIPIKLAVAVGVRGGGRQTREGAIGLDAWCVRVSTQRAERLLQGGCGLLGLTGDVQSCLLH